MLTANDINQMDYLELFEVVCTEEQRQAIRAGFAGPSIYQLGNAEDGQKHGYSGYTDLGEKVLRAWIIHRNAEIDKLNLAGDAEARAIDRARELVASRAWTPEQTAAFMAGHPREAKALDRLARDIEAADAAERNATATIECANGERIDPAALMASDDMLTTRQNEEEQGAAMADADPDGLS